MDALSILDSARSVPSAAVFFLVKIWLRDFKSVVKKKGEKKNEKKDPFPCITFCEGLQGSVANEDKYGVTFHAGPSSPGQARNGPLRLRGLLRKILC